VAFFFSWRAFAMRAIFPLPQMATNLIIRPEFPFLLPPTINTVCFPALKKPPWGLSIYHQHVKFSQKGFFVH
jgi:hypothetical protein